MALQLQACSCGLAYQVGAEAELWLIHSACTSMQNAEALCWADLQHGAQSTQASNVARRQHTLVAIICEDRACYFIDLRHDLSDDPDGPVQAHQVAGRAAQPYQGRVACAWGQHAHTLYTVAGGDFVKS